MISNRKGALHVSMNDIFSIQKDFCRVLQNFLCTPFLLRVKTTRVLTPFKNITLHQIQKGYLVWYTTNFVTIRRHSKKNVHVDEG